MSRPVAYFTNVIKSSVLRDIVDNPAWEELVRTVHNRREWLDRVHVQLTEIPAPTFLESRRAEYVAEQFRSLGLQRVRIDAAGNVLGERPGAEPNFIAITAHLDTVLPDGIPVEVKRQDGRFYAPGISDNGAGLSALLGMVSVLGESPIATDLSLIFVANVGEEGEGDLAGMRHLFSHRDFCRRAKAVLVVDGASIQQTSIVGLGSRRFMVEIKGPGGHSWSDFGRANPIHVLGQIIADLKAIHIPSAPRTTLNVGVVHGGTVVNAIPASAWMKVDIRSVSSDEIERLTNLLHSIVTSVVENERRVSGQVESKIVPIGNRPAAQLPPGSRTRQVIEEADQHFGIHGRFEISSTDANIPLSLGIEAAATGGGGSGGDAHTENEWYDPQGRELGLARLLLIVLMLAGVACEPKD
jgi:tripeptide aminopeptidase